MTTPIYDLLISSLAAERTIQRYAHRPDSSLNRTELLELTAALKHLIVGMDKGYKPPQAVIIPFTTKDIIVSS
ncbi:MAG: hypothetical protein JNL62_11035 [Bryobacterales bacterium]|nr:hypothetical protein [Bryobacterales bacterium]